ncbi:MAG: TIGR02186 family protein [Parvibaculaceae bacterium]|nr:TIGR02186 family protein [Parvibaculaceae bacterium]
MSKLITKFLLPYVALLGFIDPVHAEGIVTDLSKHEVAIRSNFTGADILVFGAIERAGDSASTGPADVVIEVTGPETTETVRRKDKVSGIWMNYEATRFERVPGFYAVLSSRPLENIAPASLLKVEQLGFNNISFGKAWSSVLGGEENLRTPDEVAPFSTAILRSRAKDKLYVADSNGVVFMGDTLFRASIPLPASVPVGLYTVKVYLLRDGHVVDAISSPLLIAKSGVERVIYRFAYGQPFLYGIVAVLLAIFAGWTAALIFREH